MISIQDYIIEQKPKIANLISITINSIELNTCAQIKVLFYNNDFQIIDNKLLVLQQPDYGNWGSDDQFIIDWVFQQLGLNPKQ